MARSPREWNPGNVYQKIFWRWNTRASDILGKIARRLVSEGMEIDQLLSEEWHRSLSWEFKIRGRRGRSLSEDGQVYVAIGFHPIERATKPHTASLSLTEGGGASIDDFNLSGKPIDMTDETKVEAALAKAEELVPKVIEILLEHDWEPFEDID